MLGLYISDLNLPLTVTAADRAPLLFLFIWVAGLYILARLRQAHTVHFMVTAAAIGYLCLPHPYFIGRASLVPLLLAAGIWYEKRRELLPLFLLVAALASVSLTAGPWAPLFILPILFGTLSFQERTDSLLLCLGFALSWLAAGEDPLAPFPSGARIAPFSAPLAPPLFGPYFKTNPIILSALERWDKIALLPIALSALVFNDVRARSLSLVLGAACFFSSLKDLLLLFVPGFALAPLLGAAAFPMLLIGLRRVNKVTSLLSSVALVSSLFLLSPKGDISPASREELAGSGYVLRVLGTPPHASCKAVERIALQSSSEQSAAVDGDEQTIWKTGRAQRAGDTLTLSTPRNQSISLLRLKTTKHETDFPRGFRVRSSDGTVLFEQNPWQGPVRFSEAGFPFFGPQSDVEVPLSGSSEKISIELLAGDERFDWTVAEAELYACASR